MKAFKVICLGFILALLLLFGFNKPVLADDCASQAPSDAPNLYQVSMSSSSATLYFAQPTSTFDGYVISYGLSSSADAYSVSFMQGSIQGANKYVINDLFPKTNYYFKVRATNGCASGPWSQTVSTNVQGASSLPETGPQNMFIIAGISAGALILTGIITLLLAL